MKRWLRFSAPGPMIAFLCLTRTLSAPAQAQDATQSLKLTFTTIDVPGAMATNINGINTQGDMVGYYYDGSGGATGTGFLYSGGNFTFFTYPGADLTEGIGINDSGLISGTAYMAENTAAVGFTYDGTNFTEIAVAGEEFTLINGINNAGALVGGDGDGTVNKALQDTGGRFRNVTPPPGGWIEAQAVAINNLGEIVGLTTGSSTTGFSYKSGEFRDIAVPGSVNITQAHGVNDNGVIVGWFEAPSGFAGFVLRNGKYFSVAYPGAVYTFVLGINTTGQLVGSFSLDRQTYHGFVTSPVNAEAFSK